MIDHTEIERLSEEAIGKLMEHCDSVRVFVTTRSGSEGVTYAKDYGAGNIYAVRGQISEWMDMESQHSKNLVPLPENE